MARCLLLSVVFVFFVVSMCHGHMFTLGSRGGVTPVDTTTDFFSVNGVSPCGGISNSVAQYVNVTKSKYKRRCVL